MGYVEKLRKIVGHRPIILAGSIVIVLNDNGEILLQQRRYPEGVWGLPGGLMELAETTEETARRELLEETGLTIGALHLLNVYSGPKDFIKAPNGDAFYTVTVAYYTEDYKGKPTVNDSESLDFRFFSADALPENLAKIHLPMLHEFIEKYQDILYPEE